MKSGIWFISDTHFSHKNIILYSNRPFETVKEHDEKIIENWNQKVQKEDRIYHLGDFAFASKGYLQSILDRLSGQIYFIRGNHDKTMRGELLKRLIIDTKYRELTVQDKDALGGKQKIILCHYPFETWNQMHYGSWSLHGHSHCALDSSENKLRMHVGVDTTNFFPISYEEVKQHMQEKLRRWGKKNLDRGINDVHKKSEN
jgi:calcineurin-like phosphoesterase family protein